MFHVVQCFTNLAYLSYLMPSGKIASDLIATTNYGDLVMVYNGQLINVREKAH